MWTIKARDGLEKLQQLKETKTKTKNYLKKLRKQDFHYDIYEPETIWRHQLKALSEEQKLNSNLLKIKSLLLSNKRKQFKILVHFSNENIIENLQMS